MRKCNGHLSNKNVLSIFLKEFLLREESFNLAGRSFQIVGPETLNDLGPNVIVLVLGMYSCPDAAESIASISVAGSPIKLQVIYREFGCLSRF